MRPFLVIVLCLIQLFNAGCASIVHGTRQEVTIETDPPGATITSHRLPSQTVTPATLTLKRKYEYEFEVEKPGYKTEHVWVEKNIAGWFWGNLFSWGIIGIIVDLNNGAGYKLEPEDVFVKLRPEGKKEVVE